jgi:hypothetical protein
MVAVAQVFSRKFYYVMSDAVNISINLEADPPHGAKRGSPVGATIYSSKGAAIVSAIMILALP